MTHRTASRRTVVRRVVYAALLLGMVVGAAPRVTAQENATADVKRRASLLNAGERTRLLEPNLSPEQAASMLLEQGYSPEEVDALLELRLGALEGSPAQPETAASEEAPVEMEDEEPQRPGAPEEAVPLRPFGYDLFSQGPSSFAPPTHLPVGPDYLLGPDDTVVINTWGPTELTYSVTLNSEGYVVIPEIGLVYLSGLSLGEARTELRNLFEKFYAGIQIHVTVGQLRTLRVYVVGGVVQPGAYTVSSLSTVFTALYYAGGPTEYGTLRRVRLLRQNDVIGVVDLYRYLLEGDRTHDLALENEDTIFVPPVGPRVTLRGEVRRPAIYELTPGETLGDVVRMAGGVLPTGYLRRVQIDRIVENEQHVVLDVDYAAGDSTGRAPTVTLADGDVVDVFPVLPGYANAVHVEGAVKRPGRYELKPGMTILELIEAAEGLEGEAYLPRVEIERIEPDLQVRLLSTDLGAILRAERADMDLAPKDRVRVYSIWEVKDRDHVEIFGEVRRPGVYVLAPNMTLGDLIFRAGGLKESAYLMKAEISRARLSLDGDRQKSDILQVRLTDVVSQGEGKNPRHLLQAGDKVFVRRIPEWDSLSTVTIEGEVRFPGAYVLQSSQETLAELFERAGGVSEDAFLEAAILERAQEGRVVVDFPEAILKRSDKEDLALTAGDWVYVPKVPETVQVRGAVFRPGSLKFIPGKSAEYYIKKCGGYLDRADRGRIRITRTNGEVVTVRALWFDPEVERGNVIVVPFKEEKKEIDWEKMAHIANMIAGLATTVYLITEAYKN